MRALLPALAAAAASALIAAAAMPAATGAQPGEPSPETQFTSFLPTVCMPGEYALRADMVLLIDTSASMDGAPLDAVRSSIGTLLDQMSARRDHAAVIGFDRGPQTRTHLTADRSRIDAALAALRSGSSTTRYDTAIAIARRELLFDGGERDFSNRGVIVMLADGRHDGEENDALAEAFFTGTAGFAIYTIGLGEHADNDLLSRVSDPGAHFSVGAVGDLAAAYESIGESVRRARGWCGE